MNTTIIQKEQKKIMQRVLIAFSLMLIISATAMAQVTYTDSVCASTQDQVYGITGASSTSTYTWSISTPAAGTIDNSITANDSEIEIDWGTTTGTYTLFAVETTGDGCIGDSVQLDVVINPLPTVAIVTDSVCEGFAATLTLTLTGKAPWNIDYTDGTNNYSTVASASPHVVSLPTYTTSQTITITGVTDDNSCDADITGLPSTGVTIFPKPTTGAIYHY